MERTSLKFLHLADLHLDCPLTGGLLKLPYEKAGRRAREQREILVSAVELAREEGVELILIGGDLWEEDTLAQDTVPFVIDTLGRAGMPVVIAPGNHDYYSPGSHYSSDITSARFGRGWPDNVHIFQEHDFTHFTPPGLEGVCVTGLAYLTNQPVQIRLLGSPIEVPEAKLHICVLHGSRDEYLPPDKDRTLPFSDEELLNQPFDWTALGHYHTRSQVTDKKGQVRAAYPGATCGLAANETGPHGALIGLVKEGGVAPADLVFHQLDPRQIRRLKMDISGLQHIQAVEKRISEELSNADVNKDDLTLVELEGTYPQGSRLTFGEDFIHEACFHLRIDCSAVRPEWEIEDDEKTVPPRTTEAIFRKELRRRIEEAIERGDPGEVTRLQNAMFYGLDALHGQPITPRQT